jgi:hypothetical protein
MSLRFFFAFFAALRETDLSSFIGGGLPNSELSALRTHLLKE